MGKPKAKNAKKPKKPVAPKKKTAQFALVLYDKEKQVGVVKSIDIPKADVGSICSASY